MGPRQTCLTAALLPSPSHASLKMELAVVADLSVLRACPCLGELPHNSVSPTHTTIDLSQPGSSAFVCNFLPVPWLLTKLLALPAP